jgi:hypothetical protein
LKSAGQQHDDSTQQADIRRAILPAEVSTLLDQHDGLAKYHRDDKLASQIAASFAGDLRSMSRLSREYHVPLLFVLPPSNLSDCPPFKSEFSAATPTAVQTQIVSELKQARQLAASDLSQAIAAVQQLTSKDQRYALTWYELGQLQMTARDFSGAAISFRRAKDEDVCPLRMTTPLENGMRHVAAKESVPLVDADELLTLRSTNGIAGGGVLVDHVHPSFRGHEDIAMSIADWMISSGLATVSNAAWKADASRSAAIACPHWMICIFFGVSAHFEACGCGQRGERLRPRWCQTMTKQENHRNLDESDPQWATETRKNRDVRLDCAAKRNTSAACGVVS